MGQPTGAVADSGATSVAMERPVTAQHRAAIPPARVLPAPMVTLRRDGAGTIATESSVRLTAAWPGGSNGAKVLASSQASDPKKPTLGGEDEILTVIDTPSAFERALMQSDLVDNFFSDEREEEEFRISRIRLRGDLFLREGDSLEFDPNVRARYAIPRLNNRLFLVFSGDFDNAFEDDGQQGDVKSLLEPEDEVDEGIFGLQAIITATDRLNISVQGGARFRDSQPFFFIGPRYRQTFELGNWLTRVVGHVRYFSDEGFNVRSVVDFDRALGRKYLFRVSPQARWSEEDAEVVYGVDLSLTQSLTARDRLRYQVITRFETEPEHQLDRVTLRFRYRREVFRNWLFVEVAPEVAFLSERDYEAVPGVFLRVDTILTPFW